MQGALITPDFCISTDLLQFRFEIGASVQYTIRSTVGQTVITTPFVGIDTSAAHQAWMRRVIREALRWQAKRILSARVTLWAKQTGLSYNRLTIKATSTRWGSYSSLGGLNLSLYLLLFDSALVDYVIVHELCHSRQMNHGAAFWALADSFLDGQAKTLRAQMRRITRGWQADNDVRLLLVSNK